MVVHDESQARLLEKIGVDLGDITQQYLQEAQVTEILLNPNGSLWVDELGSGLRCVGEMPSSQAMSLIATLAYANQRVVDKHQPILECELPTDGSRFHGIIPPVVSAPCFSIRKRASSVFSLASYVTTGGLSQGQATALEQAIARRSNVLVVGGTGSGKTTFANALLQSMVSQYPDHRLVVLEDTPELQCDDPKALFKRTSATVSMRALLRSSLRMRPDRLIVGEVRDGAALELLKAWNTGHPGGVATLHANSALEGLHRLEQLVLEVTPSPMQRLIAQAVDVVVFLEKTAQGRRVSRLLAIKGFEEGQYCVVPLEAMTDEASDA